MSLLDRYVAGTFLRLFTLSILACDQAGYDDEQLTASAEEAITYTDGEATALYLAQEIQDLGVRVTRLASGVPHGGDLEFADQITLGRAIDGRRGVGSGPNEKVDPK